MKSFHAELTKAERKLVTKAINSLPEVACRYCHANAQRMVMYDASGKIKYHEGTLKVGGIAHCWNSINGKILDVSNEQILYQHGGAVPESLWGAYDAKLTLDQACVLKLWVSRCCTMAWVGDPTTYGETGTC